jgi:hypothetical protein
MEESERNNVSDHHVLASENRIKLPCLILDANKNCVRCCLCSRNPVFPKGPK